MDVAGLAREPVGYPIDGLRRDWKSREVGACVRTYRLLVLVWASAIACNSDYSFPVESVHPQKNFRFQIFDF